MRKLARRARRRLRRLSGRARLVVSVLTASARRDSLYLLVSGSPADGLSPALVRTVRAAVTVRIPVEVLVLDFVPGGAESVPAELPAAVSVRRFWREAAPDGGGAAPRQATAPLPREPVPVGEEWRTGYYRAGRPVLALRESEGATLVEHYGHAGVPVRRVEIDGRGTLVRIVDLHPATGRDVTHRYLDSDGECWLSVWVDGEDGTLGPTQQHRPHLREFESFRAAQAEWVAEQMARAARRRVVAVGRGAEQVAALVR
ncbi:MAG: hypothetical protein ACRDQ7_04790 [Haloechinothrix sp.]